MQFEFHLEVHVGRFFYRSRKHNNTDHSFVDIAIDPRTMTDSLEQ